MPDSVLNPLLFAEIAQNEETGWVITGYPKTDLQAFALKARTQPTHVIEFQNQLQANRPQKEWTDEYRVFQTTLSGIRDVFRANITLVDATGLERERLGAILMGIVEQRPQILDKRTREVLPRGPGLVGGEKEQEGLNRDRVGNTRPRIENVE